MIGYQSFKSDAKYLVKNNYLRIWILLIANLALGFLFDVQLEMLLFLPSIFLVSRNSVSATFVGALIASGILIYLQGSPSPLVFVYILAAVVTTFPLTAFYHCAAHLAFRARWMNRWIGEIIGAWHMSSIDEWSIIHCFHHSNSDHPENDPHPPAGLSFFQYINSMPKTIMSSFGMHYVSTHGKDALVNLKSVSRTIIARQFLLSVFWFLALGPELYIYLFSANIVFKKLHYVWFNWATHIKVNDEVHVVDLNKGFYRWINFIALNLYNHASHHKRPQVLSPKSGTSPLVTQKESLEISTSTGT